VKCPACTNTEQRVRNIRNEASKVTRLRCCGACEPVDHRRARRAESVSHRKVGHPAMRSAATFSKELDDAAAAHG
jgi:hypothetical protein